VARVYHDQAPGIYLHDAVQFDAVKNRVVGYAMANYVIDWHALDVRR